MTDTPRLEFPILIEGQAQGEITHNESLYGIDAIAGNHVIVKTLGDNTPPVSPANGDVHATGSSPTGVWLGKAFHYAYYYQSSEWGFIPIPNHGHIYNYADSKHYTFNLGGTQYETAVSAADSKYVKGLELSFLTVATVQIAIGSCVSCCGTSGIEVLSPITVDITTSGVNGLDTGAEAATTWYYVYVIKNPTTNVVAGLLSVNFTTPTLPSGFTTFRRIGAIVNDSGSDFIKFYQRGNGLTRTYWYDEDNSALNVLSAGSAASFTLVALGAFVPATSDNIYLLVGFSTGGAGAATNYGRLRPNGATATDPVWKIKPAFVSAEMSFEQIEMPCSNTRNIEFRVTNANNDMDIVVQGFDDEV